MYGDGPIPCCQADCVTPTGFSSLPSASALGYALASLRDCSNAQLAHFLMYIAIDTHSEVSVS
jgi:hypothetical protein